MEALISIVTVMFTSGSAAAIVSSIIARKSREERKAAINELESNIEKSQAEIYHAALAHFRKELDAAYTEIERRRGIITQQDERIDRQHVLLRRCRQMNGALRDYIEQLEEWIKDAIARITEEGVLDLEPPKFELPPESDPPERVDG